MCANEKKVKFCFHFKIIIKKTVIMNAIYPNHKSFSFFFPTLLLYVLAGSALTCVRLSACSSKGALDQNLISDHYTGVPFEHDQCVTSSG